MLRRRRSLEEVATLPDNMASDDPMLLAAEWSQQFATNRERLGLPQSNHFTPETLSFGTDTVGSFSNFNVFTTVSSV